MLALLAALSLFSCGARQVVPGDLKLAVQAKCGTPALVDQRVEADVTVDEWSYNFGPWQPIVLFRFENGRLRRIETGDYGY
jgi:hypothetical protein